jgi:hypothetical protein
MYVLLSLSIIWTVQQTSTDCSKISIANSNQLLNTGQNTLRIYGAGIIYCCKNQKSCQFRLITFGEMNSTLTSELTLQQNDDNIKCGDVNNEWISVTLKSPIKSNDGGPLYGLLLCKEETPPEYRWIGHADNDNNNKLKSIVYTIDNAIKVGLQPFIVGRIGYIESIFPTSSFAGYPNDKADINTLIVRGSGFLGLCSGHSCNLGEFVGYCKWWDPSTKASVTTRTINVLSTSVECPLPQWKHAATEVQFQFLKGSEAYRTQNGKVSLKFNISEYWYGLSPKNGPARGGEILRIMGHGFDVRKNFADKYFYRVTFDAGRFTRRVYAMPISSNELLLLSPKWLDVPVITEVTLQRYDKGLWKIIPTSVQAPITFWFQGFCQNNLEDEALVFTLVRNQTDVTFIEIPEESTYGINHYNISIIYLANVSILPTKHNRGYVISANQSGMKMDNSLLKQDRSDKNTIHIDRNNFNCLSFSITLAEDHGIISIEDAILNIRLLNGRQAFGFMDVFICIKNVVSTCKNGSRSYEINRDLVSIRLQENALQVLKTVLANNSAIVYFLVLFPKYKSSNYSTKLKLDIMGSYLRTTIKRQKVRQSSLVPNVSLALNLGNDNHIIFSPGQDVNSIVTNIRQNKNWIFFSPKSTGHKTSMFRLDWVKTTGILQISVLLFMSSGMHNFVDILEVIDTNKRNRLKKRLLLNNTWYTQNCKYCPEVQSSGWNFGVALKQASVTIIPENAFYAQASVGWGYNYWQQLRVPKFFNATNIFHVSAGKSHSCGIKQGNVLSCWGIDGDGASYDKRGTPQLSSSKYFVQISSGAYHSCGITTLGVMRCWGSNINDVARPPDSKSIPINEVYRQKWPAWETENGFFKKVAAGTTHTCAIESLEGKILCWGNNEDGQLGPYPRDRKGDMAIEEGESTLYGQISGPFLDVAVGIRFSCGLREDGIVKCWGANDSGEACPPNRKASKLSLGLWHGCIIDANDENIVCWGRNYDKQVSLAPRSGKFAEISLGELHSCGSSKYDQSIDMEGQRIYVNSERLFCWGRIANRGELFSRVGNQLTHNYFFPLTQTGYPINIYSRCSLKIEGSLKDPIVSNFHLLCQCGENYSSIAEAKRMCGSQYKQCIHPGQKLCDNQEYDSVDTFSVYQYIWLFAVASCVCTWICIIAGCESRWKEWRLQQSALKKAVQEMISDQNIEMVPMRRKTNVPETLGIQMESK